MVSDFQSLAFLRGRDDRGGLTGGHGVVALAGMECAVGGETGDLMIRRNLVEKSGRHWHVTDVADVELGSLAS